MSRLLKILGRTLAFAFLFGVLLVGAVAVMLNTTAGSKFVINRVTPAVPGSLYLDGVDGTLWRTLQIRVLRYRNESIQLSADQVELAISWPNLVAGSVVLNKLSTGTIETQSLAPVADAAEPLAVSMPPLPFSIAVREGHVDAFILRRDSGDFSISAIDWSRLRADGQRIRGEELTAEIAGTSLSVDEADVSLAGDVPIYAVISWRRLADDSAGSGVLTGSLAELSVEHTLRSPVRVETDGIVRLLNRTEPEFDLRSTWDNYAVNDLSLADGEVRIAGLVDDYEVSFSAEVSEPRIPVTVVTGSASGNTGELSRGEFSVQNEFLTATAEGSIAWQPAVRLALDVDVDRLDPALASDQLTGSLTASFGLEASGPDDWQVLDARVEGTLMDLDVAASGSVSGATSQISCANCVVDVRSEADPAITLSANIEGNDRAVEIEIAGAFENLQNITAAGRVLQTPEGVTVNVDRAALDEPFTGRWVLGNPMTFRAGNQGVEIETHRWLLAEGQANINKVSWSADSLLVDADVSDVPLSLLGPYVPSGMRLDGTATANFNIVREADVWSGSARWQQSGTVLHVDRIAAEPFALVIPEASADATFADSGARIESRLRVEPGVNFTALADITSLASDPQINGTLAVNGEQWDWVTALLPEIDGLSGDINATVAATGPLLTPTLTGEATFVNGGANIPALNVPLRDVDLTLQATSNDSASISGSALAGDGRLQIVGSVENMYSTDRQVELKVTGNDAELVNWTEYHLWASPDLAVTGSDGGWDARGSLTIPRADIEIRELPETAVSISEDVRTADVDYSTAASRSRFSGEADIVLGDNVNVSAFGLTTRLEGALLVRKNPGREVTAQGEVRLVDGEFVAYGQRLRIQEGTLTFIGDLDNPIVDVRATRTIEGFDSNVVAGLHLTGRARNIVPSVYSEPAMSEADALSYLVIGRPLADASDAEGNELSDAAIGLGLRRAGRITQQIGQSVGLDELRVVGSGGDATALVAGKQVNSRLYARYSYGVFSRLGMIMLRYRLSERLSLEAGAGENQSIDILYTVEKE